MGMSEIDKVRRTMTNGRKKKKKKKKKSTDYHNNYYYHYFFLYYSYNYKDANGGNLQDFTSNYTICSDKFMGNSLKQFSFLENKQF